MASTLPLSMMVAATRRGLTVLLGALGIVMMLSLFFHSGPASSSASVREPIHQIQVDDSVLKGGVISSKIGNETVK